MALGPVDCFGGGSGLREGVAALPPSVTTLRLPGWFLARREGGAATAAWRLESASRSPQSEEGGTVTAHLELCAAFDQPGVRGGQGKPCSLGGSIMLGIKPPAAAAGREALAPYVGQCAELAGRLRGGGGGGGVRLILKVDLEGWPDVGEAGEAGDGPDFVGALLGAVLPGAAPQMRTLQLHAMPGGSLPGFGRHLTAPGLAFPQLEVLGLRSWRMAAGDVAALARLEAPRLSRVELSAVAWHPAAGHPPACPLTALAMGLPRPVDAAGRPGSLAICALGTLPNVEDINSALAAAGRGWVRVSLGF